MTQLREDLQWRGPVETCSRAGVEPMGDGGQRALGVAGQVGALGRILAQQAIGVLICAAQWPGTVRVATSAGWLAMGVMFGEVAPSIRPPAHEADVPDAAWPTVHCAGLRAAAHTPPQRWSPPRGVYACRQDTRGGGVR
jgi:hypothetical protein